MRVWRSILVGLLAGSWALASGAAPPATETVDSAIQAIQQAPDPSAAVTAYANGFALDRHNPRLYDAYVSRMVELGLPEMAFHQAQALTTLQADNGLAWGVVAYVDARRAQMPEAISAINLAGQFAPDNKFVQHTAGELVAWYDLKADKASIPENTKEGLTKVRKLLEQRPTFTQAYDTARKAYQTPSSAESQPAASAPAAAAPAPTVPNAPQVPMAPEVQAEQTAPPGPPPEYGPPPPAPPYYPDYSGAYPYYYPDGAYLDWGPTFAYGWGPGWVAPAPWWWWQPCGFWSGFTFFPFGVTFAFNFNNHHHDGHQGHDGNFHQDGHFAHNGASGHGHDPAFWHSGGAHGQDHFFGTPARPSDSVTHWARAGSSASLASTPNAFGTGTHVWSGAGQHGSTASAPLAHSWSGSSSTMRAAPTAPRSWSGGNSFAPSGMAPRSSGSTPGFHAPAASAPHFAAPSQGFSSGFNGWHGSPGMSATPHSFGGGVSGFPGGSSSGGGFHSAGGMGGGGFHGGGGAMGGGGHGGGGGGGGGGHR